MRHDSRSTLYSGHQELQEVFLKITDIVFADTIFSIRPFVARSKKYSFHFVSRFRNTANLYYVYTGHSPNKPDVPQDTQRKD